MGNSGPMAALVGDWREAERQFSRILGNEQSERAALRGHISRYHRAREASQVAIWEEDWSEVRRFLWDLPREARSDLRGYLASNRTALYECASLVRVLGVNKAALELFDAESEEQLVAGLPEVFTERTYDDFIEPLLAIQRGDSSLRIESSARTLKGRPIKVLVHWLVPPSEVRGYGKVLAAIEDISSCGPLIVGESPQMRQVFSDAERVAGSDASVLITGETGTGKELIARAIHECGGRGGQLVKVNCAAIVPTLVESELFGHERGAFTGATERRRGRFEIADGGSLFLDEVAELDLGLQAKLLRVLQDGEFEPVGSSVSAQVDVRIIAATNRDLQAAVSRGEFRADLYYRLAVFPIHVPPLRERTGDLPPLANHILRLAARRLGRSKLELSPTAMVALLDYDWPGNVRELENVIERAAILATDGVILPEHLLRPEHPSAAISAATTLASVEREHIMRSLKSSGWVIEGERGAAVSLGIKPGTLRSRMKKLGIQRPRGS